MANAYVNGTNLIAGSSMTNPQFANYQGSQTYAPRSVPEQQQYLGGQNAPYIGGASPPGQPSNVIPTGYKPNGNGGYSPIDVNAGSDPNHPQGWGIDFGYGQQAIDAYNAYPGQVDAAYGDVFNTLNTQEQDYRNNEPNLEAQFTSGVDAQKPILEQSYTSGVANAGTERQNEEQRRQNVLAEASRLYNELSQGVKQRFGGSSGTGEFANQFYGRELQKQQGNINQTSTQNIQKLVAYTQDLKGKYDAQLQSLESQRQGAIAQAKNVLQQQLDSINQQRVGAQQNKAAMKLQALQQMQQQVFAISQQTQQFQQQLYAQQQAADLNLRNAVQGYQQQAGTLPTSTAYTTPSSPQIGYSGSATAPTNYAQISGGYGGGSSYQDYLKKLGLSR